jgi:hypothetical protein
MTVAVRATVRTARRLQRRRRAPLPPLRIYNV